MKRDRDPSRGICRLVYGLARRRQNDPGTRRTRQSDRRGVETEFLDSDELRVRLLAESSYTSNERDWFYAQLVRLAQERIAGGANILIAATAHRCAYRDAARSTIRRFAEVYVVCPPAVCRRRDPKGLWRRAEAGLIDSLPGVGACYEVPEAPEAVVHTDRLAVNVAAASVVRQLDHIGLFS